jgi:VanZ family protein
MMPKTSHDFIKRWLPVILWLSFVFFMSTGTFSAENTFSVVRTVLDFLFPRLGPHQAAAIHVIIRKAAHVFEYFILGLLLLRAFRAGSRGTWKWRWSFFAIICLILWSLGDEFHQSFVPTRTASMTDVAIDTAGGVLAQFVGAFWHRYLRRNLRLRLCPL